MKVKNKIQADIKKFGWHIINVLAEESSSNYSYSIGLEYSFNHPEIVISGLGFEISKIILNEIVENIVKGKIYELEKPYTDILENFDCVFKNVKNENHEINFGRAVEFYSYKNFKVIQLFYPDKNRNFPWDSEYKLTVQEIL